MARRAQPVSARPGLGAAACIAALMAAALVAVALRAETGTGLGPADGAAIRFTLVQAASRWRCRWPARWRGGSSSAAAC